jgi:hypothetical protein
VDRRAAQPAFHIVGFRKMSRGASAQILYSLTVVYVSRDL